MRAVIFSAVVLLASACYAQPVAVVGGQAHVMIPAPPTAAAVVSTGRPAWTCVWGPPAFPSTGQAQVRWVKRPAVAPAPAKEDWQLYVSDSVAGAGFKWISSSASTPPSGGHVVGPGTIAIP